MSKYLKDFFIQPYIVRAHEVISEKQTFCVACVKKTKFSPKISLFANYYFALAMKNISFLQNFM
jgi:hypothetical protein